MTEKTASPAPAPASPPPDGDALPRGRTLALLVPFARGRLGPIGTPVLAGVFALLAMLSKENLIVLPAIALLQLWWMDEKGSLRSALLAAVPECGLSYLATIVVVVTCLAPTIIGDGGGFIEAVPAVLAEQGMLGLSPLT